MFRFVVSSFNIALILCLCCWFGVGSNGTLLRLQTPERGNENSVAPDVSCSSLKNLSACEVYPEQCKWFTWYDAYAYPSTVSFCDSICSSHPNKTACRSGTKKPGVCEWTLNDGCVTSCSGDYNISTNKTACFERDRCTWVINENTGDHCSLECNQRSSQNDCENSAECAWEQGQCRTVCSAAYYDQKECDRDPSCQYVNHTLETGGVCHQKCSLFNNNKNLCLSTRLNLNSWCRWNKVANECHEPCHAFQTASGCKSYDNVCTWYPYDCPGCRPGECLTACDTYTNASTCNQGSTNSLQCKWENATSPSSGSGSGGEEEGPVEELGEGYCRKRCDFYQNRLACVADIRCHYFDGTCAEGCWIFKESKTNCMKHSDCFWNEGHNMTGCFSQCSDFSTKDHCNARTQCVWQYGMCDCQNWVLGECFNGEQQKKKRFN